MTLPVTFQDFAEAGSPTFTATPNNTNYSVTGSTCTSAGLSAGQQCILMVTFTPTKFGSKNAGLVIVSSEGPGTTIKLLGTGASLTDNTGADGT